MIRNPFGAAVIAGMLLTIATACSSLDDMRASEPTAQATFSGQWRTFAECVNFRLNDQVRFDPASSTARLINKHGNFATGPIHDYDIMVRQVEPALVHVELRQRWTLNKDAERRRLWDAVQSCAAHHTPSAQR